MIKGFNIGSLKIKLPIVQGGMGVGISLSGLASAVANQGGIGVISAVGIGMLEPNYRNNFRESNNIALHKEIRKARSKTKGVLGVNMMVAASDFDDQINIAVEEKIDVIFMGAGLPLRILSSIPESLLENTKTKFIPKVSSAKAARLIFEYWYTKYGRIPDALVIEGPKSGGHQGFKRSELDNPKNELQHIVRATVPVLSKYEQLFGREIPIITGGGIYSGYDMYEALQWGAKAVKMGTKFVTTHECDAAPAFKESYLRCKKDDIIIIDSPVGLPGRVIKNEFVKQILNGITRPVSCPWKCLKTCDYKNVQYCIAEALFNAAKGNMSEGFSFAGTNAYLATKIKSVKETIDEILFEYQDIASYSEQIESMLTPRRLKKVKKLKIVDIEN